MVVVIALLLMVSDEDSAMAMAMIVCCVYSMCVSVKRSSALPMSCCSFPFVPCVV